MVRAKQVEQDVNSGLALSTADPVTGNNSWTVGYSYDDNSNIISTTDARNVTISATYDNLNRIKTRDYSDSTPDVSFYYDGKYLDANDIAQTATGSVKGKTTSIKSSVSKTNYPSFDTFGRPTSHQQITDGTVYSTGYVYNLFGVLIEETYPSGRVVRNTIDQDGDLSQVQSRKNLDYGYWAYASSFSSDAAGNLLKMQLGNGRWENFTYNNRQQVTQIGLGTTDSTQNLLKLEYSYKTTGLDDNNGSLREQKITVPTVGTNSGFTAIQSYTYDDLNRISSATETVSSTQTWKQTFNYDRFGNRTFDTTNNHTTTLGSCTAAVCNPAVSTSNNRFSSTSYSYDPNGSVTQDASGQRFSYDAENHQNEFFKASNSGSTPDATYFYDGSGLRVKKITAEETTVFVYDASSKLVAEYSTQLAQTQQVSYLTQDHLGSTRVVTNENGAVVDRKDYSAFGEETITSQRTSGLGYRQPQDIPTVADKARNGYTGYERDDESGLEFAQARYFSAVHGRFTSVDPLASSATIRNPQSFNRYSYVLNSPYKFSDPPGLLPLTSAGGACAQWCPGGDGGSGGWSENYDSGQRSGPEMLEIEKQQRAVFAIFMMALGVPPEVANEVAFGHPLGTRSVTQTGPMSKSEAWVVSNFLDSNAYFSNPNDGDPIDQTLGYSMKGENKSPNFPENHAYGSMSDPNARTDFYIASGGRFMGTQQYNEFGTNEKRTVALIYFAKLGEMRNVTVAAFHLVNIKLGPVQADGRRKLGEMGPHNGGEFTFNIRDANGRFLRGAPSFHYHLEIYRGMWSKIPAKKPHTNFNGVVR